VTAADPSAVPDTAAALVEAAPAKVNLTLHVLGRRADGYHEIESLFVFAELGDRLSFTPEAALDLSIRGPTATAAGSLADNLVLRAAQALAGRVGGLRLGHFVLDKHLPVAAGIGGGSADAAAALRLLARANDLAPDDPRLHDAARAIGADVPACLDPRPRMVRGIGERLGPPLALPRLSAVLVNPGVAVATREVFARLQMHSVSPALRLPDGEITQSALILALSECSNDLEPSALTLAPVIREVLTALHAYPACRLARMSGSGSTCFGLFDWAGAAEAAAAALSAAHPDWWVRATSLAGATPSG
jgi:4-diphosphocytidyl-2-C-methyl-D-erythritol kinase